MGANKKLYGWYPTDSEFLPLKVDSAGKVVISNIPAHKTSHQDGGSDEISLTGLIGTTSFIGVTTFYNSWVNYGGVYDTAGYCKDSFGFVYLKGIIKSGVVAQKAFVLPTGYRPLKNQEMACISNSTLGIVAINTLGEVTVYGSNIYISLLVAPFYVG